MPVVSVQARFLPSVEPVAGKAKVCTMAPVATLISSTKSGCATPETRAAEPAPPADVPPTRRPRIVPEGLNLPGTVL